MVGRLRPTTRRAAHHAPVVMTTAARAQAVRVIGHDRIVEEVRLGILDAIRAREPARDPIVERVVVRGAGWCAETRLVQSPKTERVEWLVVEVASRG
jgi:hypothetical protein